MDIIEAMKERKSVRSYNRKPLDRDMIDKLHEIIEHS